MHPPTDSTVVGWAVVVVGFVVGALVGPAVVGAPVVVGAGEVGGQA